MVQRAGVHSIHCTSTCARVCFGQRWHGVGGPGESPPVLRLPHRRPPSPSAAGGGAAAPRRPGGPHTVQPHPPHICVLCASSHSAGNGVHRTVLNSQSSSPGHSRCNSKPVRVKTHRVSTPWKPPCVLPYQQPWIGPSSPRCDLGHLLLPWWVPAQDDPTAAYAANLTLYHVGSHSFFGRTYTQRCRPNRREERNQTKALGSLTPKLGTQQLRSSGN